MPLLEAAEALGHVDLLQPKFSAVYRDAAADVLPWCADHDTAAIVYSPMVSGLLTGTLSAGNVAALPPDDWRSHHPDFAEPAPRAIWHWPDGLRPVANRYAVPVAAVAVAWTLAFPRVTGAIVGARRPEQIDGWLAAGSLALDDDDLDEIAGDQEDRGWLRPATGRSAEHGTERPQGGAPSSQQTGDGVPPGDLAPVLPRERRVDPFTLPGAAHRRRSRSAVDLRT